MMTDTFFLTGCFELTKYFVKESMCTQFQSKMTFCITVPLRIPFSSSKFYRTFWSGAVLNYIWPTRFLPDMSGGPTDLRKHWYLNIVAAFRGMHVSPAKHSYCMGDYQESVTTGQTHTDRRRTKWSLCAAAMLRRRHKNETEVLRWHAIGYTCN